ncbi:hypothetical protein [Cupriavidus basilensis]|uniref:hypothetical protein n=1 Tax=Cupriavidus basilensis TaxID=68895 RepID=UPI0005B862D9|nr:hypothetical protein [Cupriavidus basilensis]
MTENAETSTPDEDDLLHFRCCRCGKVESVTPKAYENGDTGWYMEDVEDGSGVCGGSQWCLP